MKFLTCLNTYQLDFLICEEFIELSSSIPMINMIVLDTLGITSEILSMISSLEIAMHLLREAPKIHSNCLGLFSSSQSFNT
jgi:hypothetical protein